MAHRQDHALGHAFDGGFLQTNGAIVHARQAAEHAPKAERQAAGDDAERFGPAPARRPA